MAEASGKNKSITGRVALTIRGKRLDMEVEIPDGRVGVSSMLSAFRSVSESLIDLGVSEEERLGRNVSCKKGCGACCRQLVPISAVEARELARVVERMPAARQELILERFAAARERLADAEMLDPLLHPDLYSDEQMRVLGREYFKLGIACPFLEDEACSIYRDRPITCREYLVTSPAQNCASPRPEEVERIASPVGDVWAWVARMDERANADYSGWIPLILGLDYVANYPVEPTPRPGNEWVEEFFRFVCKKPQESSPQEAKSA